MIKNGIFMYFKKDNKLQPRKVINIRNTIIQTKDDLNSNENIINLLLTKALNTSDGTMNI